ncbi:MAG TPA: FoF1 ATP synthase subunit a [Anaerolineales bacterium]
MDSKKHRILGIPNRYYILLFIILSIVFAYGLGYGPVLPRIQLPYETIHIGGIAVPNTFIALIIADVILILIALGVRRATSTGELVPKGLAGAMEALLEALYNLTESTAGRWTKTIFPFFATITLLVLVVNWTELIPGVDSIGVIEKAEKGGHAIQAVGPFTTIIKADGEYNLVPFVRVLSTDLNFTVALALISVTMTQVIGLRALGPKYLTKFFNVSGLFSRPAFGAIDFGVGLLELISEISKILSFAFRLFGNIFAGSVLLFVIGTLVPVFAQSIFLMLEFFVGLIQAVVFGMLTMVFMAQAAAGHGDHEEMSEAQREMPIEEATI